MDQSIDNLVDEIPGRGSNGEAGDVLLDETGSEASQTFDAISTGNDAVGEDDSFFEALDEIAPDQDMDEYFKDSVQEQEEPLLDSLETSNEDLESSSERRYLGAGLLVGAAAAGTALFFQSFSNILGQSAGNDDDDLRAVLSEAIDVDDVETSMALGSDVCKASMEPTGNGFGASNVTSCTPVAPPPGVESAA
jgi:hypothetical protein